MASVGGMGGGEGGLEINKIKSKNPKTCFIIIYFRVGFLILLFTY